MNKKWIDFHSGSYKQKLDRAVAKSWDKCYSYNIDPGKNSFHNYTDLEFIYIKKKSTKIYAYTNRLVVELQEYQKNPRVGFALFDNNACLLKLYGSKEFLHWANSKGIEPKTMWNEKSAGTNAVALGLELNKPIYLEGACNFCENISDMAIYFAPFAIEDDLQKKPVELYGGIAVIGPDTEKDNDYLITVITVAKEVGLHLYLVASTYNSIQDLGLLHVDIDKAEKAHILYHSSTLFDIFEIPHADLYFKDLGILFDLHPQNQEFWEIIHSRKRVNNYNIRLSIQGKKNSYVISSETFEQNILGFRGIKLVFDSQKRINSSISRKVSNNAQLTFTNIIGGTPKFMNVINHAKRIALSDSNVLILGESGVGKDIFAQAIHNASKRKDKPFIALNCAAFSRDLIISELFGYEAGAFTGSRKGGYVGKFELANTGTIFLDEIGDMPLDLQATLLRVIEQKSFMRLGSNVQTNIDVRIIAATNADLLQNIKQRKFREDLYYRLSTFHFRIPALRERQDDIELLTNHFIDLISLRQNKSFILSYEAMELIKNYPWKGNVRELQNTIEGVFYLYPDTVILPFHLNEYLQNPELSISNTPAPAQFDDIDIEKTHINFNNLNIKKRVENALRVNKYNKTNAAQYLGVSRKTLYRWIKEYDL